MIIEDGANLNFKGYSRAFIENIQLSNDINITAEKKSQISIDTEFTLDNNCTILIKDQAVLNLRNIEIIGGHLLSTGGTLNVNGRLNIHSNNIVNSFNGSIFVDSLYIQQFSHLAIQGDLTVNKFLSVSEGCSLSGKIQLYGGVHIKGSKSAPVIISDASIENQSESEFFYYSNINFNSSIIHINFTSSTSIPNANLIFEYCNFNNSKAEIKFKNNVNSTFQFTSCVFNADNSIKYTEFYKRVDTISRPQLLNNKRLVREANDLAELAGVKILLGEKGVDFYTQTGLRPTIQITGLKVGYVDQGYANIVPAEAEVRLNFRIVASQKAEVIARNFEKFVKKTTPKFVDYELKFSGLHDPVKIDTENKYFDVVEKLLKKVYGSKVNRKNVGGAIPFVGEVKKILGVDTLMVPLCNEDCNMHGANENFDVDLVMKALEFSKEFLGRSQIVHYSSTLWKKKPKAKKGFFVIERG